MIKVVVPYVVLHPWTRRVVDGYPGLAVEYARLTDGDHYRRLLRDIWAARETVVLIEQDVVPWPGAIEELAGCMGRWCANSYRLGGGYGVYHGLGCTKLSGTLMDLLPDLWDEPCQWDVCDQRLWFAARAAHQDPHPHRPPVLHLSTREYDAHPVADGVGVGVGR